MGRTFGLGVELLIVALAALLLASAIPASFDPRNVQTDGDRTAHLLFWTREVSCTVEATGERCWTGPKAGDP